MVLIGANDPPPEAGFLCVPSMIDSLEVQVLYPADMAFTLNGDRISSLVIS
ncbi:hypothetical protein [Mesorhizobium sp. M0244]